MSTRIKIKSQQKTSVQNQRYMTKTLISNFSTGVNSDRCPLIFDLKREPSTLLAYDSLSANELGGGDPTINLIGYLS